MIHAQAAVEKSADLTLFSYQPDKLGDFDVEVQISHCGICHSDIHLIDNDWGISKYPLVPGHEIIGTVVQKGSKVNLEIGSRVGVGWQRSACGSCDDCTSGNENLCIYQEATCNGHHGGFADRIIADSRFVFLIPDRLQSENAAPLLCAGITVFSPLIRQNLKPGQKVAVIGIGGLGHLAIQFAKKMGFEVTALSSTADKETEAKELGADHFVLSAKDQIRSMRRSQDFILNTTMADSDWHGIIQMLRSNGTLCFAGSPRRSVSVPMHLLIDANRSISGSHVGSRHDMMSMLTFAAEHEIIVKTEVVTLNQINDAIQKVRNNQARYRMVIEM